MFWYEKYNNEEDFYRVEAILPKFMCRYYLISPSVQHVIPQNDIHDLLVWHCGINNYPVCSKNKLFKYLNRVRGLVWARGSSNLKVWKKIQRREDPIQLPHEDPDFQIWLDALGFDIAVGGKS